MPFYSYRIDRIGSHGFFSLPRPCIDINIVLVQELKEEKTDVESGMIHSAGMETCDFVEPVQIRDYLRQKDSIYGRVV